MRVKVKGEPKELVGCCLLLLLIRMVNKGSKKLDLLDSIQQHCAQLGPPLGSPGPLGDLFVDLGPL